MTQSEYVVLSTLQTGASLQTALERAQKVVPQDFTDAQQVTKNIQDWFMTWTALGWFYDPSLLEVQSNLREE